MPTIEFTSPDGSVRSVGARDGASVMETAVKFGVPGVVGECGGGLSCATCHVFVDPDDFERVGGPGDFEEEMLEDAVTPPTEFSRLSCQIAMCDALDGLRVTVAKEQQ